jgi:hypothetical protein
MEVEQARDYENKIFCERNACERIIYDLDINRASHYLEADRLLTKMLEINNKE